jgi:peptide/nickel transport system substrate-binding protein
MNVRPTFKDGSKIRWPIRASRQAMNYAIDKDALIKIVTFDVAKPMTSFMSSSTPYVNTNGPAIPLRSGESQVTAQPMRLRRWARRHLHCARRQRR